MGISNSNSYKLRNRPNISENSKYHQGTFIPSHPEKCLTKINIYRSDWERKFMEYCDRTATIVQWGSEPFSIPYKNPVTNLEYCKKNISRYGVPKDIYRSKTLFTDTTAETNQRIRFTQRTEKILPRSADISCQSGKMEIRNRVFPTERV